VGRGTAAAPHPAALHVDRSSVGVGVAVGVGVLEGVGVMVGVGVTDGDGVTVGVCVEVVANEVGVSWAIAPVEKEPLAILRPIIAPMTMMTASVRASTRRGGR
jgi:hypothetical protein